MAKIKVSQKTIDQIKKMGMTKALGSASSNKSAEFQEGLRRMYGQRRLSKAMGSSAKGVGQPVGGVMGTSRAQVMTGPSRSTKKVSTEAKTVKAFRANTGQRMTDYRQGAQMLRTQQESLNKRVKAMAPAERRAYYGTQAKKAAGFAAGVGASVVGGAGIASVAAGSKIIGGAVKAAQVASKSKKGVAAAKAAAAKNVPPRSYAGIKTTAGLGSVAAIAGSGKKKK
jgi:hypothetical protein